MNLNATDFEIIKKLGYPKKVQFSCGPFWVKKCSTLNLAINELIYELVARTLNIKSPNYHIVEVLGNYYLLSPDLEMQNAYLLGLTNDEDNLPMILKNVQDKYQDKTLINQVMTMYFSDLIFYNSDREGRNWGINKDNELVILDNENILDFNFPLCMGLNIKEDKRFTSKDEYLSYMQNYLMDLLGFLPENFKEMFEELYHKFNPDYLQNILNYLEANLVITTENGLIKLKIPEKDEILDKFKENYAIITEVMKGLNYGRK